MAQEMGLPDIQLDRTSLYREEVFTDRKAGTLRRLVPITVEGALDASRATIYSGQTQLLTPGGVLPLAFDIDAQTLDEAITNFPAAMQSRPSRKRANIGAKPLQESLSPMSGAGWAAASPAAERSSCADSGSTGSPGTARCSVSHAPRSINRQRSLQNGRCGEASLHSIFRPQVGQATVELIALPAQLSCSRPA
jgi:hypothetical protein